MIRSKTLVIPSNDAALNEFIKLFSRSTHLTPIFYLNYESKLVSHIQDRGWIIAYEKKPLKSGFMSGKARMKSLIKKGVVDFFDKTKLGCYIQCYLLRGYLANILKSNIINGSILLKNIIRINNIESCLISTDRSVGIEASIMYLSKTEPIKIIVLAFAYSSDYKSSFKLRNKSIYNCNYPKSSSNQYRSVDIGSKLFFRPFEHYALDELKIFPINPWVLGAGQSDCMLVDSEREKKRLVALGGREDKYIVTGTVSHDCLYDSYIMREDVKSKLIKKYSLQRKKILIVALPQYYEHGLCNKERHFTIIDNIVSSVIDLGFDVILSLHPKMNRPDYAYLESVYGVVVSHENLSDIIVAADLFVSTYSSTISWAKICNISTIIFDFIGLNYTDFYNEFFIPVVSEFDDLSQLVTEIRLTNTNEVSKSDLSPFDGMCLSRIEGIVLG